MASGHVNRRKGRTHGRTDQTANVKKILANALPVDTCRHSSRASQCPKRQFMTHQRHKGLHSRRVVGHLGGGCSPAIPVFNVRIWNFSDTKGIEASRRMVSMKASLPGFSSGIGEQQPQRQLVFSDGYG